MRFIHLATIVFLGLASMALAGPKLYIPEETWDFGNVPQRSTLTHSFWLKNVGDETLRIIRIKPG